MTAKNPDGTLKPFYLKRDFKALPGDRFELAIAAPGQLPPVKGGPWHTAPTLGPDLAAAAHFEETHRC